MKQSLTQCRNTGMHAVRTIIFISLLFATNFKAFGQGCPACFSVSPLTFTGGCPGSSLLLNPTLSGLPAGDPTPIYKWTGSLSFSPDNTLSTTITVPAATTVVTLSVTAQCPSALCGGNFPNLTSDHTGSSGNVAGDCFGSSYGWGTSEGNMEVVSASYPFNTSCPEFYPLAGSTYMLCVNGNWPGFGPYFWSQTVPVCENTTYTFTYWARLLSENATSSQPRIQVSFLGSGSTVIEPGTPIGPISSCGEWEEYTYTWNSGASTSVFITMSDLCLIEIGNDFAIDNITFTGAVTLEQPITIIPLPTPVVTITCAANACVGSPFTYTVTGPSGDVVDYKITYPGGTIATTAHTIPSSGFFTVTVPAGYLTTTGTVCLDITSITAGTCTFPVSITKCMPVDLPPTVGIISGSRSVCQNAVFTEAISGTGGETFSWSCAGAGGEVAPPATETTGTFTATSSGIMTITCTATNICGIKSTSIVVTVNPSPGAITPVPAIVCSGSTTDLTDATGGGTWSSSHTTVATVGSTGIVTGVLTGDVAGTTIISYIINPGDCAATTVVTVYPDPPITGNPFVCLGSTTTLHDAVAGGTWYSSGSGAPVGASTGIVTGGAAGTYIISYITAYPGYCYNAINVTVNPLPNIGTISGTTTICVGSASTLTDDVTGGTWSSSSGHASVGSSSGIVTGVSSGTATIIYTVTGPGPSDCKSTATTIVTIITTPAVPTITPADPEVYAGCTVTLNGTPGIGTGPGAITSVLWTVADGSGTAVISTYTATPTILTGETPGTVTISYTVTNMCGSKTATTIGTVLAQPVITISSDPPPDDFVICAGSEGLANGGPPGGTWSSGDDGIAIVGSTSGIVTGISAGTTTLTYAITLASGCMDIATLPVTVDPIPATIMGITELCSGTMTTLSDATTGGFWSSSNDYVATVGTSSGVLTGIAAGTATISYILPTVGCESSIVVTVNQSPGPISGKPTLCVGVTTTFSDALGGGTWTSTVTGVATIGSTSGLVTGISAGTTIISYVAAGGPCPGTEMLALTVNPLPGIINGQKTLCIGSTATLTDATTGGTWSSSNIAVATIGSSSGVLASVATGTTIITYTLNTGCFVTSTVNVIAPKTTCVCTYVDGAGSPVFTQLGASGTITSVTAGSNYYITNNVTISGTVTFTNCVVVMAPSVTVTVASGSKLTLDGSHLFCCPGNMWQGIVLANSLFYGTGKLEMLDNAMIEDAQIAVSINDPTAPGYAPGAATSLLTLYVHGATFNKNNIGILIADYDAYWTPGATTELDPGYPFVIENTVFTSRDFYIYPEGDGWPFTWPATTGAYGLKTPWIPADPYEAPYNINNPAACVAGAYTVTTCNSGISATAGIAIENTGYTNATGGVGAELYCGVAVGGAYPSATLVTDLNMFDNINYGIYADNSNVTSRNSVYLKGGAGIYSERDATGVAANGLYRLDVYGNATGYSNQFWDCGTSVDAEDLYFVRGIYSQMTSSHSSIVAASPYGKFGYNVKTSNYYDVYLCNNSVTNLYNAVNFITTVPAISTPPAIYGQVTVDYNTINATSTGGLPGIYNEYVYKGISVQSLTSGAEYVYGSQINIDNNIMNYVYNGIYAAFENSEDGPIILTADNNNIMVNQDLGTPAWQAGIEFELVSEGYQYNNTITGPGYAVPVPGLTYSVTPLIEGIHTDQCSQIHTECNTVTDINTGMYFGTVGDIWVGNIMQRNSYGYVLGGWIGAQPMYALPGVPTGNEWSTATGGGWTGWGVTPTGPYQTYAAGTANSTLSPMTVSSSTLEDPTVNGWDFPLATPYSSTDIITSTDPADECVAPPITGVPPPPLAPVHLNVLSSQQQLDYVTTPQNQNWIAQMATWRAVNADTTLDTNAVLHSFRLMANNCRYAYIAGIEKNIATGHYTTAAAQLATNIDSLASTDSDGATGAVLADDTTADSVVSNYRQYYGLLIKYHSHTLTTTDSANVTVLAYKCPAIDGAVIYQARALYSLLYNDLRMFADEGCGGGVDTAGRASPGPSQGGVMGSASKQQYTLSPNPSNGNVTLKQAVPDANPVKAQIWNDAGISVFEGQFHFTGGVTQFSMINKIPGLYLLQLTDSKGMQFMLKFVVE